MGGHDTKRNEDAFLASPRLLLTLDSVLRMNPAYLAANFCVSQSRRVGGEGGGGEIKFATIERDTDLSREQNGME